MVINSACNQSPVMMEPEIYNSGYSGSVNNFREQVGTPSFCACKEEPSSYTIQAGVIYPDAEVNNAILSMPENFLPVVHEQMCMQPGNCNIADTTTRSLFQHPILSSKNSSKRCDCSFDISASAFLQAPPCSQGDMEDCMSQRVPNQATNLYRNKPTPPRHPLYNMSSALSHTSSARETSKVRQTAFTAPKPHRGRVAGSAPKENAANKQKASHCDIERRYRENLSSQFSQLEAILSPSYQGSNGAGKTESADCKAMPKNTKGHTLAQAIDHIRLAQQKQQNMTNEIFFLQARIVALEKLVNCDDCWLLNQYGKMRIDHPISS
jgi:hypothetical protein